MPVMNKTQAKKIIDKAWVELLDIAQARMSQGASYELSELMKSEQKEGRNPSFTRHGIEWAKAGIIDSVIKGATNPPPLANCYGIRLAHVAAMVMGAAYADAVNSLALDREAIQAARDLF